MTDRRSPGEEPALLLGRAELDESRPEQLLAHMTDPGRSAGQGVLLVKDQLLFDRRGPAAVLARPAERRPARFVQLPVKGQPLIERLVLAARPANPAQPGKVAGQMLGQPVANQVSEFLVGHAGLPLRRQPSKHWTGRRAAV